MSKKLWFVVLLLALSFFVTVGNLSAITVTVPTETKNGVKVHFYIDGHRRMRLRGSFAFERAVKALQRVLMDRNNPLDAYFREKGYWVETNTGTAYLFTPELIEPFSLAKKDNLTNLGGEYTGSEKNFENLVRKIMENEPKENVIVCIITNNSMFPEKDGICFRDVNRKITFFVLNAGKVSVDTGRFFTPYWSIEEWEKFIVKSLGESANDVAKLTIDDYYALSDSEKESFEKISCSADRYQIRLKDLFFLPKKPMWEREIFLNGKPVEADENEILFTPRPGQNKIKVTLRSPVGYEYSQTWDENTLSYGMFSDEEKSEAVQTLKLANDVKIIEKETIQDLQKIVENKDRPICSSDKKAVWDQVRKVASVAKIEQARVAAYDDLKLRLQQLLKESALIEEKKEVQELSKKVLPSLSPKQIQNLETEFSKLALRVERSLLCHRIKSLRNELNQDRVENVADLDKFLKAAQTFETKKALSKLQDAVENWKPIFKPVKVELPQIDPLEKKEVFSRINKYQEKVGKKGKNAVAVVTLKDLLTTLDPTDLKNWYKFKKQIAGLIEEDLLALARAPKEPVAEKKSSVQKKKDSPKPLQLPAPAISEKDRNALLAQVKTHFDAMPESVNHREIEFLASEAMKLDSSKLKKFTDLKKQVQNLITSDEPIKSSHFGSAILIILVVLVIAFFIIKAKNRPVASLTYSPFGKRGLPIEIPLNKQINLGDSDCIVDVRVSCIRDESKELKFDLLSPNNNIWVKPSGGNKRQLGDVKLTVPEGDYLLYDDPDTMREFGKLHLQLM